MIRARLHSIESPDLDLEREEPSNREDFGIPVTALVGADDLPGGDLFEFFVCTPSWIAAKVLGKSHLFAHGYLVVAKYEYVTIRTAIQNLVSHTTGDTWQDVAGKLGRYAVWEFHDYRPLR